MSEPILVLTDTDVRELLDMTTALTVCEEVFRAMAAGRVTWGAPPRLDLPQDSGRLHYYVKACSVDAIPAAGFRVVGYGLDQEGRISGHDTRHVILVDPRDARTLMIMDEHWSYALRTAASAGVVVRHLARRDSRVAGLVGAGLMAWSCALALREVLPELGEIRVTSRRPETRARFAAAAREKLGLPVVAVDDAEAAVGEADVVITATTAEAPLVRASWLRPGSVAYAMGAGKEVEDDIYSCADKVLVDDWTHCLMIPEFRELVSREVFSREKLYAELAEVVGGQKPGRETLAERIFVRSQGLAVQDIALAHRVYELARARKLGAWLGS